ncbi:hypothetical protein EIN_416690 [Entamoeba invadens IP1]|uniref:Uncharacterized protein n=1 Tax=Entamoeba invadens IP1 TaxID=370355 RepID=A0A0A1TUC3_ENTIV|nr:hypothetical protein EIN_416690 [Entamoeba invadens IP1]ELP83610.1 hypothetical protein EIN_416690 [Entamoeba invadens IP1]|eukprot:XP_004182956.1 hypothetical protein EIN_416690 [Entamoeba invadens IP1]
MSEIDSVGIVLWGKEKVGKSSIVNVWTNTPQPSSYDHHEPRKVETEITIPKGTIKLKFFDVAAENIEDKSVTMETHNKSGPIQVFVMSAEEENDDVDYCRSLYESPMWNADDVKETAIILNKMDIAKNNNEELLKSFLEKYPKIMFFKTSLQNPDEMKKAIVTIVDQYVTDNNIKLKKVKGSKKEKPKKEKSSKDKVSKDKGCKNQ